MKLKQLESMHYQALHHFELKNLRWFESYLPPRPNSYETFEGFSKATDLLLEEQANGECSLYIATSKNKVVLRANITNIHGSLGSVGYRVCGSNIGKGLATKALCSLVRIAEDDLGLKQLSAMTTTNNLASIRVLEKLGFDQVNIEYDAIEMNGEILSFIHFIKQLGKC
ncbi:MAG: GNAT family N-acetyltransferase [Alteromonadales bacterium]|nr:GNAT family N-acetyltransferase [Alteromonadales bacterium]